MTQPQNVLLSHQFSLCPFFSLRYCPRHCLGTYEGESTTAPLTPFFIQVSASLATAAPSHIGKGSPAQLQAGERGGETITTRDAPNVAAQGGEQPDRAAEHRCWHCGEPALGQETSSGLFQPKSCCETRPEIQSFRYSLLR